MTANIGQRLVTALCDIDETLEDILLNPVIKSVAINRINKYFNNIPFRLINSVFFTIINYHKLGPTMISQYNIWDFVSLSEWFSHYLDNDHDNIQQSLATFIDAKEKQILFLDIPTNELLQAYN